MTCWVEVVRWGLSSSSRSEAVWEWIQDSMGCQFVEELRFVSASRPPPRPRQQHQQLGSWQSSIFTSRLQYISLYSASFAWTRQSQIQMSYFALTGFPSCRSQSFLSTSTYVSLIGSGEGRHTTHLLKCVLLLSTSQTDWKQSSDVLSDISFDILSDISSDISSDILSDISFDISSDILSDIFLTYLPIFFLTSFWHIFLHPFWHIFWHSFWHIKTKT